MQQSGKCTNKREVGKVLFRVLLKFLDSSSYSSRIVFHPLFQVMVVNLMETELQKRADRADQSVLIFLAGANFWEKHAKKLFYYVHGSCHLHHSTLS